MSNLNKVFLGIIGAVAVVVLALAAAHFEIHNRGQKTVADREKAIGAVNTAITKIKDGTAPLKLRLDKNQDEWSLQELIDAVRNAYDERGRAWFGCIVSQADIRVSQVPSLAVQVPVVITGPPDERGFETNAILPEALKGVVYVFEVFEEFEAGKGIQVVKNGTFLGRFAVATSMNTTPFMNRNDEEKEGYRITLTTTDSISEEEVQQIIDTDPDARWAIYLNPPVERLIEIFDRIAELADADRATLSDEDRELWDWWMERHQLTEEQKQGMGLNPNEVFALWERIYGQDPEEAAVKLGRDLAVWLDSLYTRRDYLNRTMTLTKKDLSEYEKAGKIVLEEQAKLVADREFEEKRVAAMEMQRDTVKALWEEYRTEADQLALEIKTLKTQIAEYVAKITEAQLTVAEKIEERTRSVAQAAEDEKK